jgi:hypothetical protein
VKRIRKPLLVFLALVGICVSTFWIPSAETIAGPKTAKIETLPDGAKFGISVQWWDRILNSRHYSERLTFGTGGQAELPAFRIETSVGRRLSKRVLTALGLWPGCEHCDGPCVQCSLYQLEKFSPPAGVRLVQGQTEREGVVIFTVGLIPDESQFEPRPFSPADSQALLAECRDLIAKGESPSIDPSALGSELKRINPVRVESSRGAIVLWMGD